MAAQEEMPSLDELKAKLSYLNSKPFRPQMLWFLNAYWERAPLNLMSDLDACRVVYEVCKKCEELAPESEEGTQLDEFQAHRLLEAFGDTLSVRDMRQALSKIDIDFNRHVSLAEYLIYRFSIDWHILVTAPDSGVSPKVRMAQRKLENAQRTLDEARAAEERAGSELMASKEAEATALEQRSLSEAAVAEAQQATRELGEAKEQQEHALAELQAKEKEAADAKAVLESRANDESLGIVKRNKARAELAQMNSQDSSQVQMAKIHQEATLRKVTKAIRRAGETEGAAAAAARRADEALQESLAAHGRAEVAMKEAGEAVELANQAFEDAFEFLEETKRSDMGNLGGTLWVMDHELELAKARMPRHKVKKMAAEVAAFRAELHGEGEAPTA